MRYLTDPVSHLCIPYSTNAAYDGLDMYIGWRLTHSKWPAVWWAGHRVHIQRSPIIPLQRRLQSWYEGPKMDYINWESMADNKPAWKQELSSSLKKGGTRHHRSLWRERRKMEESLSSNVHPTHDSVLPAKAATATASDDCTPTSEDTHLSTQWVLPP